MSNPRPSRPTRRVWAVAAACAAGVTLLAGCATGSDPGSASTTVVRTVPPTGPGASATAPTPSSTPTRPDKPDQTVRVTSLEADGQTYGVGMPLVLYFSPPPTDASAFTDAVTVTVDGRPADGAWYWEQPTAEEKHNDVAEAHYRPKQFWPAHSRIHVDVPIGGLSAGSTPDHDLVYSDRLTSLDYRIGPKQVSVVDAAAKRMKVYSDGELVKTIEVSLGAAKTPTYKGVKVVMQKGENAPGSGKLRPRGAVIMQGPGYGPELVDWSVRITQSGEYVHAAPWNSEIGQASTSNGCTNLSTSDAEWFYKFSRLGDIVKYANAPGPVMRPDDGLGDWNVPWSIWKQGGPAAPRG